MIQKTFLRITPLILFAASAVSAQTAPATTLPAASTLTAKYADLIGGPAYLKAAQVTTKGSLAMTSAGINATFELTQKSPNTMQMVTTIPGVGAIQVGYDGTTAWSIDPMQGPRLLAGKEMDEIREEADVRSTVRSPDMFSAMQTVADTTMNDERCYLVKFAWKSGRETYDCYSAKTGLLVATNSVQQTAMGAIPVATVYADYKKFGDFMVPTKTTQSMMGQQQVMTISSVEVGTGAGVTIAPPAEIKALIKK